MKLQYRMSLSIAVILLAVSTAGSVFMLYQQRISAQQQFERHALSVAEWIADSTEHFMLEGKRDLIRRVVARAASVPLVNEAVLLSHSQTVLVSAEPSEVGQARDDEAVARAITSGEQVAGMETRYGRRQFRVILPLANETSCQACHGSEAKVLGAIEVGLLSEPLETQIRDQTAIMIATGGLTFLVAGAAITFTFRSTVLHPLSKLAASARRIAAGDLSSRAPIEGKNEIAHLARVFNDMAEQVERQSRALKDFQSDLEQNIRERTAQLEEMVAARGQLLQRLISAQEEERRRVARELHDTAGQALTMTMVNLSRAADALPAEAHEAQGYILQSRSLAAQALADVRKTIYDLRPEALDQLGLVPAIHSYIKSRLESKQIKVNARFTGLGNHPSDDITITLFRVIQESISNIARHSGASQVDIDIAATDSEITATVSDNGMGFDVKAAFLAPHSWGLRGMRERTTIVGGQFNIESRKGQGTRLWFRLPLQKK